MYWAHPRSRGEHGCPHRWHGRPWGSSPLARGTQIEYLQTKTNTGLIPARAGNTGGARMRARREGAHPRSRGEHQKLVARLVGGSGSSPLARGTRGAQDAMLIRRGLIPARAGNTGNTRCLPAHMRAHPRSRGEHPSPLHSAAHTPGSSPLARGTPVEGWRALDADGLIPARAGNTIKESVAPRGTGAHPRSRGEHMRLNLTDTVNVGSSPLARGTRPHDGPSPRIDGLIPARAGNTITWLGGKPAAGAHPRSRGEHLARMRHTPGMVGSSPLARGTRLHRGEHRGRLGLIPARAGNTHSSR